MKILITGIAGLLGCNLGYILNTNHQIIGIDRNPVLSKHIEIHQIDLRDIAKTDSLIIDQRPEVVIHCAAATNVDWCEENEEEAYILNTAVTKNLVEICNSYGGKLVFISTDAVFDGNKNDLCNEDDLPNPLNIYGITKMKAEEVVLKSPKNLVLRTNLYGYNVRKKYSLGEWIIDSLKKKKKISMFYDVYFSPILVNEIATIIIKLIELDAKGIYHVCGKGAISKYDFGMYLKEIFGIQKGHIERISIEDFKFKAMRAKNMGMSNEKLEKVMGFTINSPYESINLFKSFHKSDYHNKMKRFYNIKDRV